MLNFHLPEYNDSPLHSSLNLVNKPTEFKEHCFREIGGWLNEQLIKRLGLWLDYFNEAYFKYLGIYSATVFAVVETYNGGGLLYGQSRVEYETSILFYEELMNVKPCLQVKDRQVAAYLLAIALFFGNFPGLVLSSKYVAFEQLPDAPKIEDIQRLFVRLFVKYETTPILLNHLPLLTVYEAHVYASLLAGRSLRRISGLPMAPSKKECYLFNTKVPQTIKFNDRVLDRGLLFCQVLKVRPDSADLLMRICNASKVFAHHPDFIAQDIKFWQHVLSVLSSVDCLGGRLQDFVDYFEYVRYESSTPDATLHKTLEGIERDILRWHMSVQFQMKGKNYNYHWAPSVSKEKVQWMYDAHYQIKELTSGNELVQESIVLEHCVFSYIKYCEKQYTSIFSLQKKQGGSYQSQVTIEVKDKAIVQASGKQNRDLSLKEKRIIKAWGREYNFKYDLYDEF